jgi:hypothetical protein
MKVRWTSDSVRLRITPTELAALERGEVQRQEISFPGGSGWAVRVDPDGPPLGLRWLEGTLLIHLSRPDVERLAEVDREGIYLGGGPTPRGIRLLIEKDFPCAHPHSEEAAEPETERFGPTQSYRARKAHHGEHSLAASRGLAPMPPDCR